MILTRRAALAAAILLTGALASSGRPASDTAFVGYITDTECGPDHAPMMAKGDMGANARECTYRCVEKGATFGFVDAARKKFYQLDDQEAPRPYAGLKVRIEGTLEADTIRVRAIEPVD